MSIKYDKIIIGAGLYGLYSALLCGKNGQRVIVLEYGEAPFMRATYINQARVHMGYHYPRSMSTALKSAGYFERFNREYKECILSDFDQIYGISSDFSWTNAEQFKKFCKDASIRCDEIAPEKYFVNGKCESAFLTREYTYDAHMLKNKLLDELSHYHNVSIKFGVRISEILKAEEEFCILTEDSEKYVSSFILNATYASVNQINSKLKIPTIPIKYELCEIILCKVNGNLDKVGLTVMDGPFFSIMPFGKTGYHSLTSVTFTPHTTCHDDLPIFPCQKECENDYCSPAQLGNCNLCSAKPETAWKYMSNLARKYMREELEFEYVKSLYSMKPILRASEIDDSRPTVIKEMLKKPRYISVLSGKINTVYDLDEVLLDEQ